MLNVPGYFAEVQRQLSAQRICSVVQLNEIGIKKSNDLSEQYAILISDNHLRRGPGSYLYGCSPAEF